MSLEHQFQEHAKAMRSLALALVGERHADDLVQDTLVQALQQRDRHLTAPQAWLATVMRFLAHKLRRGERRRSAREQSVARADVALPDAGAETREAFHQLTAAVQALPEPYHTTILLRYLRELPPADVAVAMQAPVATVKTRLVRGLAMLREHFDAHERDRGGDWRRALVGAFGFESAAVVTEVAGVFAMTTAMKWTFGGVAAAIAIGSLALFVGDAPWSTTLPPADGRARPELAVAAVPVEPRDEMKTSSPAARDAVAGAVAADAPFTIHGRCVDENGAALAALPVELCGRKIEGGMGKDFEREYGEWLDTRGDRAWRDQALVTGSDGRFEFAGEPSPLKVSLLMTRDGVQHSVSFGQIQKAEDHDVGDLVIPIACKLRCRVVDERGRAVPSPNVGIGEDRFGAAAVRYAVATYPSPMRAEGDGVVTSTVVAGRYRCDVSWRTIVRGDSVDVPVRASVWEHEIVVAAAKSDDTIRGIVVDERGAPVADAHVFASRGVHSSASTDPAGRFTLHRGDQADGDVEVKAHRNDLASSRDGVRARWGDDVELVLRDLVAVDVRVVADATGDPVTDFKVWAWPSPEDRATRGGPNRDASGRHANGVMRLRGLVRGRHLLVVEPHRRELWRSDAVRFEAAATHVNTVDVRLRAAASRPLLVVASDGKPVPRASVELIDTNAAAPGPVTAATRAPSIDMCGPEDVVASRVLLQQAKTDAAGEALLHGPAERLVVVRIAAEGFPPFCVGPMSLDDPSQLVATVPAGAKLIARITPREFVAELQRPHAEHRRPGFRLRRGSGTAAEFVPPTPSDALVAGADGVVTIDGVPPGEWRLALEPVEEITVLTPNGSHSMRVAWPAEPFANVTLRAGETTEATFDLSSWLPSQLTGIVHCNGEPVAGARIYFQTTRAQFGSSKRSGAWLDGLTGADGRFRYRGRAGTVRVLVNRGATGSGSEDKRWVQSQTSVELPPNTTIERDFDVVSCAFTLRVVDAAGAPVRDTGVLLVSGDGARRLAFGGTDVEGRVAGEAEPGTFEVQIGAERTRAGTVTIAQGAANEFELRR